MFLELHNEKVTINEKVNQINDNNIGGLISYSLYFVGQTHVWHLLTKNAQQHTALGQFYTKLDTEIDSLAEKYIGQGGQIENVSISINATYDEYTVLEQMDYFREYVSSVISMVQHDPEMASFTDGVTDLQELIDHTMYMFKLK